jgi:hypothetical protein
LAQTGDVSINQFLFDPILRSIHTFSIEFNDGLILSKSLIPHQNLRDVNLVLQTIDDLYILLDGLVPNIQTLIVRLCKSRILCTLILQLIIHLTLNIYFYFSSSSS